VTDQLGAWVAIVGGVLVILGMLWRVAGLPIRRIAERQDEFREDWTGRPARPGRPAVPGVMERLAAIEARVTAVEHEMRPNSGSSLRDAVDRVEQAVRPPAGPGT